MSEKQRIRKAPPAPKKTFNPAGAYKWEPTDEFILSGSEFDLIYNIFQKLNFSNEHIPAQALVNGYNILFNLIKTGYENGIINEFTATPQPQTP